MAKTDKAKTNGISLPESDWEYVALRGRELDLDPAEARSAFIRLLVDLDRQFRFKLHPHQRDKSWRLYEEQATYGSTLDEGDHPPNPERNRGAGPAAEIPA